ncbi:hypothetical protein F4813DRAFT_351707 [Daldinia decipiens]|uniref:uncharacterized protein n=1 Tax=Daldinia decipiens TaxID=326647 RepID=UPI0020C3B0C0|nr:uncharacterized protein F4813DRAFT_351707 [Daldinia decipiens]KAI1659709.1 hypothetical protein F4813DRAFT_351707 [Daldinia decipiens]
MKSVAFFGLYAALLAGSVQAQGPYDGGDGGYAWAGWPGNNEGSGYGNGPGSSGTIGGGLSVFADFDVDKAIRYRTAHGIIAALCFVVIFPIGAILVRLLPSRHTWIIHAATQVIGFVLYIAAAALGIHLIEMVRIPPSGSSLLQIPSKNAHPIIGIVLLVVLFIQPQLGFAHHSKFKRLRRRTLYSHAHLWLGRIAITLGIINGGLGLKLAEASQGLIIAYSIVSAFAWLMWAMTAVLSEMRRRENLRAHPDDAPLPNNIPPNHVPHPFARDDHRRHNSTSNDPSPPYTPGPIYGGPPVYRGGQTVEMMPTKNTVERQGSVSSFSSELTPVDGRRRP